MPLPDDCENGQDALISEAADEAQDEEMDILVILEAMGAHFKEHHEAIMRWSWKLFCRKWARLMKWAYEEHEREQQRKTDQAFAELRERG